MTKKQDGKIIMPKRFVGLHSHSTVGSPGDAIGTPGDHIDFARENGMDALALTDHGNMNGTSHQYLYNEKLKKKGINFKPIFGSELYFIDSLKDWRSLYEKKQETKARNAFLKKQEKLRKEKTKKSGNESDFEAIGDEFSKVREEAIGSNDDEDLVGTATIENEDESKKSNKWQDPINMRSHLVLLPKNEQGLKSLYALISKSFIDGFYKYPRIDFDLLKEHSRGNLVASSACIAGHLAKPIFKHQLNQDWESWGPGDDNFELIQKELKETVERFQDALGGKENFNLEIQFNRLPQQHLVNMHLIECAKRTNSPLIVTCDAHYARPEHWKEREIYKLMAWSTKTKGEGLNKDAIPQKIEDLKCELYPKNAEQVWESYKQCKEVYDFYDDQTVCDAIERTWSIAHEQIEDIEPNRKVKLPSIHKIIDENEIKKLYKDFGEDTDEDTIAFKELKKLAIDGLVNYRKKGHDKVYVDRLKYELEVVRDLKFSKYFITYEKIMRALSKKMITGAGRGSAAGALLSYVLDITQIDPIKNGLLFERFLVPGKKCLELEAFVMTENGPKQISDIVLGEKVLTHTGEYKEVKHKTLSLHNDLIEFEMENGSTIKCSPNHMWIVKRKGETIEVRADEISETDEFISMV